MDFLGVCTNPNRDGLPYWPTPNDAPDSCSCNLGKMEKTEYLITKQMTECSDNSTNTDGVTDTDVLIEYGQACLCCGYSAIISAYDSILELQEVLFNPSVTNNVI